MFQAVDHVEVVAEDLERTLAFYTNVLGFTLARRVRYDTTDYAADIICVTLGDFMVEILGPAPRPDPDGGSRAGVKLFALRVDDMAKTIAELERKGVAVTWGPRQGGAFDGIRAEIKDPNGISIELREWQNGDSATNPDWQPSRPGVTRID
jgi:glyoxylase I family protein